MIVDVHTHLPTHMEAVPSEEERVDTVMRPDRPVRTTNSVDDYLRDMAMVDRCIIFGIAPPVGEERAVENFPWGADINDRTAQVVARAPDKVIGFMSVNPEDPRCLDEVERCVQDLGLKGIKLGPNYQRFDPLGEKAFRLYARAQELGLPIVFHQGTSPIRFAPLRYAHPIYMDEIAMRFPDLKIVMAHMGHPWQIDTIAVIRKHPNVYADVSAQFYRPWSYYNGIRLAWEWRVLHKVLFATDWPVTTPAETVAHLRGFNSFARRHHLPEVPDEELEGIINRNSLELLGLG